MLATVTRVRDSAQLYLRPTADGVWQVANSIPSGISADPDVAALVGALLDAQRVLEWAAGRLPSTALLACPRAARRACCG